MTRGQRSLTKMAQHKVDITTVNSMDSDSFVRVFGNVVEQGALVAAAVYGNLPFTSVEHLHMCICDFLDRQPQDGKQTWELLHQK